MTYPYVKGEVETMALLGAGHSIARLGDGELKIIYGAGYVREPPNLRLGTELFNVLNRPAKGVLVGIPTLDPKGPKAVSWERHRTRFEGVIKRDGLFVSAFITRPDSAPWIETPEFLESMLRLWNAKRVALVCEKGSKLLKVVHRTAATMKHIEAPSHGAYAHIDAFEATLLKARPDVALLSVGPTATCLANRLGAHGVQALDLGSVGGMLARLMKHRGKVAAPC